MISFVLVCITSSYFDITANKFGICLIVLDREEAKERREIVSLRINEIENNRKEALNLPAEENKKELNQKEENDDSDEEGKVRQSKYTNQKIAKYTRKSETEVFYFHIFIIGRNQTQSRKKAA